MCDQSMYWNARNIEEKVRENIKNSKAKKDKNEGGSIEIARLPFDISGEEENKYAYFGFSYYLSSQKQNGNKSKGIIIVDILIIKPDTDFQ